MFSQLKNSKRIQDLSLKQTLELSPTPITSLKIFSPTQFSQQPKYLSLTQPINGKPSNTQKKKPTSQTKYNMNKIQQKQTSKSKAIVLESQDIKKILEESENLIKNNEVIEGINLLKAMKDTSIKIHQQDLKIVIFMNLAVAYYQTGFLQEAYEEFIVLASMLEKIAQNSHLAGKSMKKLLYMTLQGKVQLQICILFSQMGKHEEALKHARKSCKINFQLIYEISNILCKKFLNSQKSDKIPDSEQTKNILNNILLLQHLHKLISDLNQIFHIPQKIKLLKQLLIQIKLITKNFKDTKVDMDMLFHESIEQDQTAIETKNKSKKKTDWIFTNKILDQIQLKSLNKDFFDTQFSITNPEIVQKITYLAISFYCYSTQIRFIEKNQEDMQVHEVMDSQHWLSRSLEIAYSFMPPNAPILNQILTVHDRFHGIDKQTIPEDKQIRGFFKVLRPLSKPKSIYSSKSHMCSPIMIRIQAPKITIDIEESEVERPSKFNSKIGEYEQQKAKIFDLEALTKNNKIKGLNTRIKILDFNQTGTLPQTQRPKKSSHQNSKITSRSTISDLSSLQSQKQKRIRISKIYSVTARKSNSKYSEFKQSPSSVTELQGKAILSEDLLHRPHSYDRNINKWQHIQQTTKAYTTQKRRKSLPTKNGGNKQKLQKIVYNGSVKFDGLKLTGKKLNQTFELDSNFLQKLNQAHNLENNEDQTISSTTKKIGANIFINNNINLYISKGNDESKTTRQQNEFKDQLGKRQKFIYKRRLSHLNIYPSDQFHL